MIYYDNKIEEIVDSCDVCSAVKELPKEVTEQSTSKNAEFGTKFCVDVLQRKE